jgi:predicted DNA-binding ribbon-helix-helix protein
MYSERIEPHSLKTTLVSRNVTILRRRTSIRLEPEMWSALNDIAMREGCSIHDICSLVSIRKNASTSLTAAIRVFLMLYYRAASNEEGHRRAGHGNFDNMRMRARLPKQELDTGAKQLRQSNNNQASL